MSCLLIIKWNILDLMNSKMRMTFIINFQQNFLLHPLLGTSENHTFIQPTKKNYFALINLKVFLQYFRRNLCMLDFFLIKLQNNSYIQLSLQYYHASHIFSYIFWMSLIYFIPHIFFQITPICGRTEELYDGRLWGSTFKVKVFDCLLQISFNYC